MWKNKKLIIGTLSFLGISIIPISFLVQNKTLDTSNVYKIEKINKNDDTSSTNTTTTNIVSSYSTNLYIDQGSYQVTTTETLHCFTFPTILSLNLNVVGNQNVLVVNISSDSNNGIQKSDYDNYFNGSNLDSINKQFTDCINTILSTVGNVTQDNSGNSTGAFTNSVEMSGFRISNLKIGFNFTPNSSGNSGDITIDNTQTTYDLTTDHDNYTNELGKNNELTKTNANQLQKINTLNNTQIALIVVMIILIVVIAILVFIMIRNKKRMKE